MNHPKTHADTRTNATPTPAPTGNVGQSKTLDQLGDLLLERNRLYAQLKDIETRVWTLISGKETTMKAGHAIPEPTRPPVGTKKEAIRQFLREHGADLDDASRIPKLATHIYGKNTKTTRSKARALLWHIQQETEQAARELRAGASRKEGTA